MSCLQVLGLLVLLSGAADCCVKVCEFLYNNPGWDNHSSIDDTSFEDSVDKGKTTGIITASFDTFPDTTYDNSDMIKRYDFFRFHTTVSGGNNQSLFFFIYFSRNGNTLFYIRGRGARAATSKTREEVKGKAGDIQISDENPDFYQIYLGDPGAATSVKYSYDRTETWDWFQNNNVRLQDTVRIKNDGRCTVFKYISACSDPTPRICNGEEVVTRHVSLGTSMTLTCTASGAPYLDVEWTRDNAMTEKEQIKEIDTSEADNRLESSLIIENIQTYDLGTWKCKVFNKNFQKNVTKTYILEYSLTRSVIKAPDLDYYTFNNDYTEFQWVVEGWPLDQVNLECRGGGDIIKHKEGYTTSIPPQVSLTLRLRGQDVVVCILKDGEESLRVMNITRVGYSCKAGEGGVGKKCQLCQTGYTTLAGEEKCSREMGNCEEGYWGYQKIGCRPCPQSETSIAAVKIQECFPDVSYCYEGQFGYGNNCALCPNGKTSFSKTKKEVDCFPDISNCKEGYFGFGLNCSKCPAGKTSFPQTKKNADCFLDVSNCKEGEYGYGNNCTQCPNGKTSFPKTKKKADCFLDISDCKEGYFGFGSNCTMCQAGKTSFSQTKKKAGCFDDVSDCKKGDYGYGTNCIQCPNGETSFPGTKKLTGCFPDISNCTKGLYGYGFDCNKCPEGKTSQALAKLLEECIDAQPNLVLSIGAGAGGFIFILIVLFITILFIRNKKVIKDQKHESVPRTGCSNATEAGSSSDSNVLSAQGSHAIHKPIKVRRFKATGDGIYANLKNVKFIPPNLQHEDESDSSYATLDGIRGNTLPTENSIYLNQLQTALKPTFEQDTKSVPDNSSTRLTPIHAETSTGDREGSCFIAEGLHSTYSVIQREPKPCEENSSCSKFNAVNRGSHASEGGEESTYSCLNRLDRDFRPGKRETRNQRDSSLQATPSPAETQNSVIQRRIALCEEESPYANFGTAKRASAASDDDKESEYSSLNRLRNARGAQGEQNRESTYTNLTRKFRHDTTASPLQERRFITVEGVLCDEKLDKEVEEDSTYASVELVQSSRLRQRPAEVLTRRHENVNYCTISELRENPTS